MDELEEHRELDRLIADQELDDTFVVYHEEPGHRDDVSLEALGDVLTIDEDGEVSMTSPHERGTVLIGSASFHGTLAGYTKQKCRCPRCSSANAAYMRDYRARKKQEAS